MGNPTGSEEFHGFDSVIFFFRENDWFGYLYIKSHLKNLFMYVDPVEIIKIYFSNSTTLPFKFLNSGFDS